MKGGESLDFIYRMFTVESVRTLLTYVEIFFVLYLIGYSTFLFLSVLVGSDTLFTGIKKRQLHHMLHQDVELPISILVPAYNEEVTILQTVYSLLRLDYRLYEIIIINDGSQDATERILREEFGLQRVVRPIRRHLPCKEMQSLYEGKGKNGIPITLINKENGGKADSLNMGIHAAKYPYFVCMDADSVLQRDSLRKMIVPMLENRDVVAVGGMLRISNDSIFEEGKLVRFRMPKKFLPAFQVLEYERSFLASRIFLDKFNGNLIISGAFGLFQKEAVLQVGGYPLGSMGEDMELVVRLHSYYRANRLPYAIRYAHDAVCWTQAPERLDDLLRQRKRWHIGLLQSLRKHPGQLPRGSYFYYILYELLSPVIELGGLLATLLAYCFDLLNVNYMILFFCVYALFGASLTMISFMTRNFAGEVRVGLRDIGKAFLCCIPEVVCLRYLLAWTRLLSLLFYRGKQTKWGKIQRYEIAYDTEGVQKDTLLDAEKTG